MIKKSKVIRFLIFTNAALMFYLAISLEPSAFLEKLRQTDFYIELVASILFALSMVWIFKRTLNRIE